MQGRSHSLSDRSAFHIALIAFACALMVLFSASSSTGLAGTDRLTRQIDDRVEQVAAPNHIAGPIVPLDIRFAEALPKEVVELAELTDDDETEHCLLPLHVAVIESHTGLYESSADRALIRFRLRAFSTRGSPLA